MPYVDKVQVGGTDYDIQDTKAQTEVDELKNTLSCAIEGGYNAYDTLQLSGNNRAVTSNGDGTYTVGTSDYGNSLFGSATLLKAGVYFLFGVPQGYSFLSTTNKHTEAIFTNDSSEPKGIVLESDTTLYLGFRIPQNPNTSFVIRPFLYSTKMEENAKDIEALKKDISPLGVTAFTGTEYTDNGITFYWDGNNCTINGTSTNIAWYDLITPINTIPDWLELGAKYQVYFQPSDPKVALILYYTSDGGNTWPEAFHTSNNLASVTIPTNATGFLLRIWIPNNITVDNLTVTPVLIKLNAQSPYIPRQDLVSSLPFSYGSNISEYTSCDDVNKSSNIFISVSGGVPTLNDFPFGVTEPGWLITLPSDSNDKNLLLQLAFQWNAPSGVMVRTRRFNGWTNWQKITQDIDIESLLMNQGSLYPAGISINQVKNVSTGSDNLSFEYDFDRNMYHVVGTSSSYMNLNFCLITNALPAGMIAGEKYNFTVYVEDQQTEKNSSYGPIEFFTTTTGDGNWQALASVYSNNFNKAIPLTIPAGSNGFFARFAPRAEREYDFYFSIQITPKNVISRYAIANELMSYFKNLQVSYTYSSCDDVIETCALFVSSSGGIKTIPDYPINGPGWLFAYPAASLNLQIAVGYSNGEIMMRRKTTDWTSWETIFGKSSYLTSCDLNDIQNDGFWLLIDSEEYQNVPNNLRAGFLEVKVSSNWLKQYFYELNSTKTYVRTFANGQVQTPWAEIGSGATYNVTQNITRDSYANTYNITTSPQITTNSNGWLQAVDDETTTEVNATDMTGAIMSMLNATGYCHLGPGTFYVSGNIEMPYGATLEGCGEKTIIRLLSSVSSGYIVRLIRRNTVRGIKFSGGKSAPSDIFTNGTNLGSRYGIYLIGNANGQETTQPSVENSIINDCWFEFFDGSGFYAHNTGGGLQQGVMMSSCYFYACRVGINIDHLFEYAKFTDCITLRCYYACINNGGNNVFTGCTFHGVVGMLFDNSANDKPNNAHGSCVGCTFNHIDNMNHPDELGNGLAVHMINCSAGFIFTGCQLWYGNVKIENSRAVTFSDCLFGNNAISIEVTGDWPAFFHNNMFYNTPTLTLNTGTKFVDNYKSDGVLVTV